VTRGSLRLRLAVLFGGLFLAAGAGLVGIIYGFVSHAQEGIITFSTNSGSGSGGSGAAALLPSGAGGAAGGGIAQGPVQLPSADLQQIQTRAMQYVTDTRAAENDALLLYSGIALGVMTVLSAVLGWFAAGRAMRPLRRITSAARLISATNLHERLALDGPDDDLRELADMIDGLFARLDGSLHAQRQFVANASHELRTPLARSRTLLEVALRDPGASAASLRAACERALAAGAEQERLIEALLMLARGQRGLARREPLDLAAITRDVLAARGEQIAARGLTMEVTLAPALLAGDSALVERAVANLIDNALRHNVPVENGAGGTVWVEAGAGDDGRAMLAVANTGPDIPPDQVQRLVLPFQQGGAAGAERTRPRTGPDDGLGPGLGLGLSIVDAVTLAHDAELSLVPRLSGGGLAARLFFPPVPAGAVAGATRPAPSVLVTLGA
jgi:signal transduction histidine kinase